LFDQKILNTFLKIAKINGQLTPEQLLVLCLPTRYGGLGITRYEEILHGAYAASLDPNQADCQAVLSAQRWDEIVAHLEKDAMWKKHLTARSKRYASLWMDATDICPARNANFAYSLQLALLWDPQQSSGISRVACPGCSFVAGVQDMMVHVQGCSKLTGRNCSTRHCEVNAALEHLEKLAGIQCEHEVPLINPKGDDLSLDHFAFLPDGICGVDVTCSNSTCASLAGKTDRQLDEQKSKEKHAKYDAAIQLEDPSVKLVVARFDVLGGISNEALRFVKKIAEEGNLDLRYCLRYISKTIAIANGSIVLRHRRIRDATRNSSGHKPQLGTFVANQIFSPSSQRQVSASSTTFATPERHNSPRSGGSCE